jgi:hypothetical protein
VAIVQVHVAVDPFFAALKAVHARLFDAALSSVIKASEDRSTLRTTNPSQLLFVWPPELRLTSQF